MPYFSFTVASAGTVCLLDGNGRYPVTRFDGVAYDNLSLGGVKQVLDSTNRCVELRVPGEYRIEYSDGGCNPVYVAPRFEYLEEGAATPADVSTLVDNGDGTFTHTAGGVVTIFTADPPPPNAATLALLQADINAGAGDTLPVDWMNATSLYIEVGNLVGDYDLTGYTPANIPDGAILALRKSDTTAGRVTFTDNAGVPYAFTNLYSEVQTLRWYASLGGFRVI